MGEGNFGPEMGPIIPRSENEPKIQTPEEALDELKEFKTRSDLEQIDPSFGEFQTVSEEELKDALGSETVDMLHDSSLFGEYPILSVYPGESEIYYCLGPHPDSSLKAKMAFLNAKRNNPSLKGVSVSMTGGEASMIYKTLIGLKLLLTGKFDVLKGDKLKESIALRRAREDERTSKMLGFGETVVLNLPDKGLTEKPQEVRDFIGESIRTLNPSVVAVPECDEDIIVKLSATGEGHPDALLVGKDATEACDELVPDANLLYFMGDPDKLLEDQSVITRLETPDRKLATKSLKKRIDLIISLRAKYGELKEKLVFRSRNIELAEKRGESAEQINSLREKQNGLFGE